MSDTISIASKPKLNAVGLEPELKIAPAGARRRWVLLVSKAIVAIGDQALTAGSHFVVGLLLARWLSPDEYGAYSLGFSIFLLLSLAHQSLLLEPQRVFGPCEYVDRERDYCGVLLWLHSGMAVLTVIALGMAACIAIVFSSTSGALSRALVGVTWAAPCVLLLWLVRGAFYVRMSPQMAIRGTAMYSAILLLGIAALRRLALTSPLSVFSCMGVAALVSSIVMLRRLKPVLSLRQNSVKAVPTFRQHWHYGRWILLSSVLSWLSSDVYYAILSSVSGLSTAGQLRALMNFALPLLQTCNALSLFAIPYVCRLYAGKGAAALSSVTWRLTWMYGAVGVAYWAVIIMLKDRLLHSLYDARYNTVASSIVFVAASSLPLTIVFVPGLILRTLRSSGSLLGMYAASMGVTIVLGFPMTKLFGLKGALVTMTASNVVGLIVAFVLVARKTRAASLMATD